MTPPHLLRVEEGPQRFAPLVEAARTLGLRVGWLELAPPSPVPGDLETAAGFGTLRAVAVGGGRAVVVKPIKGEPVLNDLLSEHFRGCVLVLVRGEAAAPHLQVPSADTERWTVTVQGGAARAFSPTSLAEALRSPRPPWAPPLPPRPPRPPKKVKKTKQEKKRERREKRKKPRNET